jgi:hypothetical protein
VPEQDLDTDHDTVGHLRDEGLVDTIDIDIGGDERGVVLTKDGRELLVSHLMARGDDSSQAFHAGISRSREIDHDSKVTSQMCSSTCLLLEDVGRHEEDSQLLVLQ